MGCEQDSGNCKKCVDEYHKLNGTCTECKKDRWGYGCVNRCEDQCNGHGCNNQDGTCLGACKPGYWG